MTVTEFLLARIAEDEGAYSGQRWKATGSLLAGVGPRMLAECEAKRRIVKQVMDAEQAAADIRDIDWAGIEQRGAIERAGYNQAAASLRDILYPLAAVYASHPDYREEWKS